MKTEKPTRHLNHGLAAAIIMLALESAACRPELPCSDCDDSADMQEEDPELPCGGADLMTDPQNCGTCGNDCGGRFSGTEYESGSCQAGVCVGPVWVHCLTEIAGVDTCAEACGLGGSSAACVPAGCSGHTALLMFSSGLDYSCENPNPYASMTGPCDAPIPWDEPPTDEEGKIYVMCCCG